MLDWKCRCDCLPVGLSGFVGMKQSGKGGMNVWTWLGVNVADCWWALVAA